MKVSVSLPADDIDFLDDYAKGHGVVSRSAVLHRAIRLLRATQLEDAYAEAWDEWRESGEASAWEATASDGLRR